MIDLKKIQERFDAFFEEETPETFAEWLKEKELKRIFSNLGTGEVVELNGGSEQGCIIMPRKKAQLETDESNVDYNQFLMAA